MAKRRLQEAITAGDAVTAAQLLADNPSLSLGGKAADENGFLVPLCFLAVLSHSVDTVKMFSDKQLRLLRAKGEETVLHVACANGAPAEIISFLVDQNPSMLETKSATEDGGTPIYSTIRHGESKAELETLLALGANVNAVDDNGATPLIIAVTCQKDDMCRVLVDNGANLEPEDRYGRNALENAVRSSPAVFELLWDAYSERNLLNSGMRDSLEKLIQQFPRCQETMEKCMKNKKSKK